MTAPSRPERRLAAARAQAIRAVNARAGEVRLLFITDIPGQPMLYLRKEAQARAFLADPAPDIDAAPYRLLKREVGITGQDGFQVATVIVALAEMWEDISGPMEEARLGAIAGIEAAGDVAGVQAAEAQGLAGLDRFRSLA